MVPSRPAIDVCIEGNICDSTARVAADIVEDGTPVFVVQQRFDPAKDQWDAFEDRKKSEYSPGNAADLDPEWQLEKGYFCICTCGVIVTVRWRVRGDDIPGTDSSDVDSKEQKKKKYRR